MKFEVQQDEMLNVLSHITGVLERTQTRDVLSHARVRVSENGELQVSCTDLTMTMVAQMQLDHVDEPGGASIPGLRLFNIFRALGRSEPVVFETAGEMIKISSGHSEYELNVMTGPNSKVLDGYLPSPPDDHVEIQIPASRLREQLLYTNPVMGVKDSRQYMVATCFELSPTYLRTVSTEASVLAMATSSGGVPSLAQEGEEGDGIKRFVVPRKTVLQVTSMCSTANASDVVKMTFGSNHFSAKVGVFTLTSNLVDSVFPQYQNVFPEEYGWSMVCDRERLREGLDQVEVVAIDSSHRVQWEFDENVLSMRSASTRNDRVFAQVALDNLTDARKIAVNGEKVLRVLNALNTEKVEFSTNASDLRANIRIVGTKGGDGSETEASEDIGVAYLLATMSDR